MPLEIENEFDPAMFSPRMIIRPGRAGDFLTTLKLRKLHAYLNDMGISSAIAARAGTITGEIVYITPQGREGTAIIGANGEIILHTEDEMDDMMVNLFYLLDVNPMMESALMVIEGTLPLPDFKVIPTELKTDVPLPLPMIMANLSIGDENTKGVIIQGSSNIIMFASIDLMIDTLRGGGNG